jgi:uncharacterized membrane protein
MSGYAFRLDYLPLIAIALMVLVSAVAYAFLPAEMTVHWNFALQPDGYARKGAAVLVLPMIGMGLIAMQIVGRYIADDGWTPLHFSKAIIYAMPILAVAHIAIIIAALVTHSAGRG